MNMTVSVWPEWFTEVPDVSDDEDGRSKLIDVTVLRRTCVHTWESVLEALSWHQFSDELRMLWDNVVRTRVSSKIFLLLFLPNYSKEIIRKILISNP